MYKLNKKGFILASISSVLFACSATQTEAPSVLNSSMNNAPVQIVSPKQTAGASAMAQALSLEKIMADPDWIGRSPTSAYWADDNQHIYYQQKREGSPLTDLWVKSLDEKGNGDKVAIEQLHQHAYKNRVLNHTKDQAAWVFEGNVFIKNLKTNQFKQLTKDNKQPNNLSFLHDGRISFQSGDALYAIHPEHGLYE